MKQKVTWNLTPNQIFFFLSLYFIFLYLSKEVQQLMKKQDKYNIFANIGKWRFWTSLVWFNLVMVIWFKA